MPTIRHYQITDGREHRHSVTVENPKDPIVAFGYDRVGDIHKFDDKAYMLSVWCAEHGFEINRRDEQVPVL